jgi:hypothetical protein
MKTSSCKAKGRLLQQMIRDKLILELDLNVFDVTSTSMGAQGSDVKLSEKAFNLFPYDIECKNQERINVWEAYEQAVYRCSKGAKGEPLVIIKRNRVKPLVLLDVDYFIRLHKR